MSRTTTACKVCGMDNDNGTHWALEDTGHLSHGYIAMEPLALDAAYLEWQREFSLRTFGPGPRTDGVLDHITKEIEEVRKDPTDLGEWVDLIILSFDGAQRLGGPVQDIIDAVHAKLSRNEKRTWPDWRTAEPGKAIEHDRSGE